MQRCENQNVQSSDRQSRAGMSYCSVVPFPRAKRNKKTTTRRASEQTCREGQRLELRTKGAGHNYMHGDKTTNYAILQDLTCQAGLMLLTMVLLFSQKATPTSWVRGSSRTTYLAGAYGLNATRLAVRTSSSSTSEP